MIIVLDFAFSIVKLCATIIREKDNFMPGKPAKKTLGCTEQTVTVDGKTVVCYKPVKVKVPKGSRLRRVLEPVTKSRFTFEDIRDTLKAI
jgi:hypothetical protein